MLFLNLPIERIEQISLANEAHLKRVGCRTLGDVIEYDRANAPYGLERACVSSIGAYRIRQIAKEWNPNRKGM